MGNHSGNGNPMMRKFDEAVKKIVDLKTNYGDEEAYGKALEHYMSDEDYWFSESFEDWLQEFIEKEELEEYFLDDFQDAIIGEIEERYNNYDYSGMEINVVLSFPKDFIPPNDATYIRLLINEKLDPSMDVCYNSHNSSEEIMIEGGKSSASFSIKVPYNKTYVFSYSFGRNIEGIVSHGEIVDENDNILSITTNEMMKNKISLFLQEGEIISGTISLPHDKFPQSDDLSLKLTAYSYEIDDLFDEEDERNFVEDYNFKKDDNSIAFSITVPKKAKYYNLMYNLFGKNIEFSPFENLGRVITDGVMNKNFVIQVPLAKKLTGKIYLPDGNIAPTGGLVVIVNSELLPNQDDTLGKDSDANYGMYYERACVKITKGKNGVKFSIIFSSMVSGNVCLSYRIDTIQNDTYIRTGFYSKTGTQLSIDKADPLSPSYDSEEINFYVLEK